MYSNRDKYRSHRRTWTRQTPDEWSNLEMGGSNAYSPGLTNFQLPSLARTNTQLGTTNSTFVIQTVFSKNYYFYRLVIDQKRRPTIGRDLTTSYINHKLFDYYVGYRLIIVYDKIRGNAVRLFH